MIAVTTDTVPGRDTAAALGIVRGSTVRAKHIGGDIVAGLRNLVGGEVHEYARLLADARDLALERMLADAARLQADAVVAVRFQTSTIQQGASEVMCYGTAVRLSPAA
ncbi:hypothetical protein OCGS_2017 [Oceaniovalibus guishaninsula JLT2003]|uniref:UPF0145 protein OCGS_2017 n=1 Tax=Oceaniovalibus guishaninsula JLT2003 TaxID=1231392 RepID=K2GMW6_9RHOB|nr:YbjQ family protein [Oceaniovalibus guishaninsula]EKE44036.1 hypothetical protein OCGS_2017 [Oceaniovalibus guishaninsula JLT2003]